MDPTYAITLWESHIPQFLKLRNFLKSLNLTNHNVTVSPRIEIKRSDKN